MSVVYIDGGRTIKDGVKFTNFGMTLLYDDNHYEFHGSVSLGNEFEGYHELYAFVESVVHIRLMGLDPSKMTFYTDDESVAYAHFLLHPNSFVGSNRGKAIKGRLKRLCDRFYVGMLDEVLNVLMNARFVKVKGHETTVYNQRVDYLCNKCPSSAKSFDSWLSKGFPLYNKLGCHWYNPHFSVDLND